ncbi:hypothetical protein [Bradyrhizobium sp. 23]|uniref:hypothetical protein n=1 Tax=Bradyrhizobium sp. 23 TaxID=2782667 RepID=UPI001FFAA098|nr:hypothetical protein [Bradyrhizobium sp. 23]
MADLLSIPTGDRYLPLNFTPRKRKEKTLHVQLAQVEGLAAQQPLLMLWEDVHWSDPTTLESLDLLIDRAATLRILVILTIHPDRKRKRVEEKTLGLLPNPLQKYGVKFAATTSARCSVILPAA